MFDVGVPELILILVVALVVFGPGKLPEIGAALGKAIGEFRRATQGISNEIQSVTKLESEDEMRTRLITEQNAKDAASAEPKS
ncbi:MAG: twin-arginine translocase TatA/TatE family subunit [Chloroflexi bacterium]|nr:twin-arginine translocase TatA/TatE family subunit [Chloroflexota bacterium]